MQKLRFCNVDGIGPLATPGLLERYFVHFRTVCLSHSYFSFFGQDTVRTILAIMNIKKKQFTSLCYAAVLICLFFVNPFVTLGFQTYDKATIRRPASPTPLVILSSSPIGSTTGSSATVAIDFPEITQGFNNSLTGKSTTSSISSEKQEEESLLSTTSSSLSNAIVTTRSNRKKISTNHRHPTLSTTTFVGVLQKCAVTLISMTIIAAGFFITSTSSSLLALSPEVLRIRRNILAGSIIFTIGDIGAQLLTYWSHLRQQQQQISSSSEIKIASEFPAFTFDQQRLTISTILGVLWGGIIVPFIYDSIERLLPGNQGGGFGRIVLKMVLSCSILSTAGNYGTMFFRRFVSQMCNLLVSAETEKGRRTSWWSAVRRRWKDCVKTCNADFFGVLMDDLKIWPLYDIICFAIIPPFIRPIVTAIMSSLWSMYMSIISATATEAAAE